MRKPKRKITKFAVPTHPKSWYLYPKWVTLTKRSNCMSYSAEDMAEWAKQVSRACRKYRAKGYGKVKSYVMACYDYYPRTVLVYKIACLFTLCPDHMF